VGEHRRPGRGQWGQIVESAAAFTILLERARLSGGTGEMESHFDHSRRCRGCSLVNASPLRGQVAARALPQAAQWFALVVRRNDARRCRLSHRSLRRDETASPDSSQKQTCSLVCRPMSPGARTGLKLAVVEGVGIGGRQVPEWTSGVLNAFTASGPKACSQFCRRVSPHP